MNVCRSLEIFRKCDTEGEKDRLYVKLENLNRNVNRWYIVTIRNSKANKSLNFHLENPFANTQKFKLDPNYSDGIIIRQGDKDVRCPLWDTEATAKLTKLIAKPNLPYVAMCDFGVYVRLKVEGYRTTKEWIVEFLRDNVWGGESITNFVKESIFKDKFIVTSNSVKGLGAVDGGHDRHLSRAAIDKKFKSDEVELGELGITLKNKRLSSVKYGEWYETDAQNDVYVSIISPSVIDENILNSQLDRATKLDGVEMKAVHYLTAFDLSKFDLEYAVGTEHPRVGWSDRVRDEYKTNSKGPDGFDSVEPIVRTGLIPPYNVKHIVSTFTAGFKRSHSAFKWGPMSQLNMGSHYGFAEKGVFFSTPQPGLATIIIYRSGEVVLKTWTEKDYKDYDRILHLRQNGLAITEWDYDKDEPRVGKFVSKWGDGNWSGSQDKKFRSLRAGMCQITKDGKNYLVYGYFSSATPAAMARVFQAYGCHYSFHLDMNALEHTYLALYDENKQKNPKPQHLVKPMRVLDERFKGNVPRFIGYPDNRDFFYMIPKKYH